MYIVNEQLPKDCFDCKHRTKCDVWINIANLTLEEADVKIDTLKYFKPMQQKCCKIITEIPPQVVRFYFKWILCQCPHSCKFCRHKKQCDIYNIGR